MRPQRTPTDSTTRRLFAAVIPPPEAVAELSDILEPHQDRWPEIRWTISSGWHFTCAFMARVDARQYPGLVAELADVAAAQPRFALGIGGVGSFPAPGIARILWAGADDPTDDLEKLALASRRAAGRAGIRAAGGPFTGHLTIARFGQPTDVRVQHHVLADLAVPAWLVTELVLVESLLGQGPEGRPRYIVVERFGLARH